MSPRLGTQLNRLVVEELEIGAEPIRVLEVIADLGIARTALGEPVRQADVELAPAQLRQEAVGGVLEERMTEPGAARRRALGELPLVEAVQLGLDRPADHRLDSVDGEVPADHGRDADDLLLGLGERLEAGREEDLERTRQAGGRHLVADEGRQVLGEQRIALGRVDDLPGLLVAEAGARVREQAPCLRVVEALQRDRHGVGPPSPNPAAGPRARAWWCTRPGALAGGCRREAARRRRGGGCSPSARPRARRPRSASRRAPRRGVTPPRRRRARRRPREDTPRPHRHPRRRA